MYLLRVLLPDRPGSLGAVATALGEADADISAVEIVEKGNGVAVDDFMLSIPAGVRPDALLTACAGVAGVEVLWISSYPENWDLTSDVEVLDAIAEEPERAQVLLTEAAPAAFHCAWALLVDRRHGIVTHRSLLAPVGTSLPKALRADLGAAHISELSAEWWPGWGEQWVAVAPCNDEHSIILGRSGPEFRPSELARLRLLALLAGEHDPVGVA